MLKAVLRAAFLTILLVSLLTGLWFYTLYTILTVAALSIFGWLAFMLYIDPPEDWD